MCLRQKNTQGEFIVVERYRTVLKKFYITKSQNQTLNYLISYTGLRNFSNYARKMLFKKFPIVLVFDETSFEDLIFSLRRIKNNINQLARIETLKLPEFQIYGGTFKIINTYFGNKQAI